MKLQKGEFFHGGSILFPTLCNVGTQTNSKTSCFNFVISVKFLFPVISIVNSTERIKYKEFIPN